MATKAARTERKVGGIGDAAVRERTGRDSDEWLAAVGALEARAEEQAR